jgi:mRNA interferase MazF
MDEPQIFNRWNLKKQSIHFQTKPTHVFPKVGEVWVAALGINIGYEQNGTGFDFSRPVLVIKKFNNKMYWVAPLTSRPKNLDFYHNYTDKFDNQVAVILAQLRLVSTKRFFRKIYRLKEKEFFKIIEKIHKILPQ